MKLTSYELKKILIPPIVSNVQVNIIGVVKGYEPQPSVPTSRTEYSCSYELIDECGVPLRLTLVGRGLPQSPSCGDILLVRRATVMETRSQLYLTDSCDNPWWLCRKEEGFKPSSNFPNLVLGPSEKSRICELKLWVAEHCKRIVQLAQVFYYLMLNCVLQYLQMFHRDPQSSSK